MNNTEHHSMVKTYLAVFGALAVLTAATVGVAFMDLGRAGNISIALVIASVKVTLIASFFMHLKFEKMLIRALMGAALFFVLVLLFLVMPDIGMR